jgi:hypothetical protein
VPKDFSFNDESAGGIVDDPRRHTTVLTITPSCRIEMTAIEIKTTYVFGKVFTSSDELRDFNTQEFAEFVHRMHAGAAT